MVGVIRKQDLPKIRKMLGVATPKKDTKEKTGGKRA